MTDRIVHLGDVAVDSGFLMIADPSYVFHGEEYERICDAIIERADRHGVQLPHMATPFGEVIFQSGLGDGIYAVEAEVGEVHGWGERIKRVTITLIEDDEEEED